MASITQTHLGDEITCTVCLQILQNPNALPCLHTYCLRCIQSLETDCHGRIQCPDCKQCTQINQIRQEFKVQRLIEIYENAKKEVSKNDSLTICDVCRLAEKNVESFCRECMEYLCEHCFIAHRGSQATRHHKLTPYEEMCEAERQVVTKYQQKFVRKYAELLTDSIKISDVVSGIKEAEDKQVADIEQYREKNIQRVNQHHDRLIEEVRTQNAKAITCLKPLNQLLQGTVNLLGEKLDLIVKVAESSDHLSLVNLARDLQMNGEKELHQLFGNVPRVSCNFRSPVNIENGEECEISTRIKLDPEVLVLPQKFCRKSKEALLQQTKELHQKYQQVACKDINYWPHKIFVCPDELWVAGGEMGVILYDLHLNEIKVIQHMDLKYVTGITKTAEDVVASDRDTGLHLLKNQGDYVKQMSPGYFSDVCVYNDQIYALEYR